MTAQVHEKLQYNGEESSMAFCPPLPENHPRIIQLEDDEIERTDSIIFSTACWRQYIGEWEIKDGKFYLVNILGRYKMVGNTPIFADWFSGVIVIPRGKMLRYVHMGFASVFEEEIHVEIKQGIVIKTDKRVNQEEKPPASNLDWLKFPWRKNKRDKK